MSRTIFVFESATLAQKGRTALLKAGIPCNIKKFQTSASGCSFAIDCNTATEKVQKVLDDRFIPYQLKQEG